MPEVPEEIRQLRKTRDNRRQADGFRQGFTHAKGIAEKWVSGVDVVIDAQVKRLDEHLVSLTSSYEAMVRHAKTLLEVDALPDLEGLSDEQKAAELAAFIKRSQGVSEQLSRDVRNVENVSREVDRMKATLGQVSSIIEVEALRSRFSDVVLARRVESIAGDIEKGIEPEAAE